ncbi:regulator of volume decrease after cellular swelling-domain-containing protein [Xylariales sp. AK1849]|nr:regulator of volume decrease after cellular swelling-domain-containing protein [Xylariales sp. AK1849]
MLPTVIKSCPSADNDFEPISEYQAQTPETFFEGKPVLYFHDENIKAWCSTEQHDRLHFFSGDRSPDQLMQPNPPECYALENDWGKHIREEERVEVFVASHKLILFSHNSGTGIEIPYPAVSIHAIKNFKHLERPDDASFKFIAVYMQLEFSGDGGDDDESYDPIELTLIPSIALLKDHPTTLSPTIDPLNSERTTALFSQISACSNLHPDPADEDDDEDDETDRIIFEGEALEDLPGAFQGDANGGLPPPLPGSSGWITAENVDHYFDQDGNWIGEDGVSGELGEGAGRVRARDEVDGDGNGVNGHEDEADAESKRPRTE